MMQEISEVIENYSGRSRSVLEYAQVSKQLFDATKDPGFSNESWDALAKLVDIETFERVGNFMEVQSWPEYTAFLSAWAPNADWGCSFKRVTEVGDLVFLELEERTSMENFSNTVNSLSVYEFDGAEKIVHIDIYLQMSLPEGVDISSLGEAIKVS